MAITATPLIAQAGMSGVTTVPYNQGASAFDHILIFIVESLDYTALTVGGVAPTKIGEASYGATVSRATVYSIPGASVALAGSIALTPAGTLGTSDSLVVIGVRGSGTPALGFAQAAQIAPNAWAPSPNEALLVCEVRRVDAAAALAAGVLVASVRTTPSSPDVLGMVMLANAGDVITISTATGSSSYAAVGIAFTVATNQWFPAIG